MLLNVYDPGYLTRLRMLQVKRKHQIDSLCRFKINNQAVISFIKDALGPIKSVEVSERLINSFRDLVYGSGTIVERLKKFAEINSLPEPSGLEPFFWLKPKSYPPPSSEMRELIENDDVLHFVRKARYLLEKSNLEDFLEFQAAIMKSNTEEIDWLAQQVNSVKLTCVSEAEVIVELFKELDEISKVELLSKLKCHPYVKAMFVRKPSRPVVLDGSNIARLRGKLSDIDFILERLATFNEFLYPYYLVFDKNIRHIFQVESEWFHAERTYFHSPADELIISIALEKNAVVVSGDRFEEWNQKIDRIDVRRFFE